MWIRAGNVGEVYIQHLLEFLKFLSLQFPAMNHEMREVAVDPCSGNPSYLVGFSGRLRYVNAAAYSDCGWNIRGNFGLKMIVNFHTLHTANLGDFVTVHDRDSSGTVIALLDGTYENESVVSCSKSLFVRYISRYQLDFSDFVASFKSIDRITSPEYPQPYPVSTRRTWTVCALSSQPTYLDFTDFDLEELDSVVVTSSKQLNATLRGSLLPFRFVLTSVTTLRFTSRSRSGEDSLRRFSARLRVPSLPIESCESLYIPYGQVNSTDTSVGTVVTVICNTGYILVGSNRRECLSSQTWSGDSACIGLQCSPSLSVRNARFVYKSNGSESVLMLVCDTGYSADGTLQAMCSISGRRLYVQHPRSCMAIRCSRPNLLNGATLMTDIMLGSTVTFSCNIGYRMVGETHAICTANRTWSPAIPICVKQGCESPFIANREVNFTETSVSTVVTLKCYSRYSSVGSDWKECLPSKTWIGDAPCSGKI
ncbi:CUB and sushi domain-containing protein 1-like [Corticium candelabrum]|uniref:CUB and sushi domain-containing protein 1-like n=1 Tax=Corticium candelabrum TaxID=121492 RepID=UPI002E26155C|nr:CUB and sushi domain-containing protein 1-like [Corticium candelabrum]